MPNTTGYAVLTVCAAGCNFTTIQAAVNAATCNPTGTIIMIQAGQTFTLPTKVILPNKSCAPGQWIILESSAIASLPPPGTRVTPADATNMPLIQNPLGGAAGGCFFVQPFAQRYRLIGLECTTTFADTADSTELIEIGDGNGPLSSPPGTQTTVASVPTEIIVDRCYLHGDGVNHAPRRAVAVHCGNCAVINSYISEIHNDGVDSQGIIGWNGTGPVLIENNFISAAAEGVEFGGSDIALPSPNQPSDITVRRNHFFKPYTWKVGHPSYAGVHWAVKNHFELKFGQRILVEGNVFENVWPDGQTGLAFNLKSQGSGSFINPWCQTLDVTVRYNSAIRTEGAAAELGSITVGCVQMTRVFFHDNLFDDNGGAGGWYYLMVHNISSIAFEHNTIIAVAPNPTQSLAFASDVPAGQQPFPNGVSFHNNIFGTSSTPLSPVLAHQVCTIGGVPVLWCFDDPAGTPNGENSFFRNLVYRTTPTSTFCIPTRPSNDDTPWGKNIVPKGCVNDITNVGFVNIAARDYHLLATSPGHNAATDGTDVGADIDMINTLTAGVR
jgi:hypothetical protein